MADTPFKSFAQFALIWCDTIVLVHRGVGKLVHSTGQPGRRLVMPSLCGGNVS